MAADMTLPVPGRVARQVSRAEIGDRIFVVGGKVLLLCLLGIAVLLPLLAIFWRGLAPKTARAVGWWRRASC